ncbi:MAG TPA: YraN family protein, partial [Candidatus Aerophobetes bacterium]|nr:YraN family protein [Candidatus Aerophobetes bacterium]
MSKYKNKEIGKRGEKLAISYLKKRGYRILDKNFRCKIGEIDIVAENDGQIVFVEVKT